MGNEYWAGALPGLVMATVLSLALLRLLGPSHIRHILWLVPALHFFGAFVAGPILSIAYGRFVVPEVGTSAPLAWAMGFLAAGISSGALAWRSGGRAKGFRAAAWFSTLAVAAVSIPVAYSVIASQ